MAEHTEEKCIERHLYRRKYKTSAGRWQTLYYAVFKDWKAKRRKFSLGSDLRTARDELKVLEGRNIRKEDFDKDNIKGLVFTDWVGTYLNLIESKKSKDRDRQHCDHLKAFLGPLPLGEITRTKIMEYKNVRLKSFIIRHGKPVEGRLVSERTVSLELSCLRTLLYLAADEGLIENVPRIKTETSDDSARERVLSVPEYVRLLAASPRWLKRLEIAAYETAIGRGDLLGLTWQQVDEAEGLIRIKGGRKKTGVKQVAPITHALIPVIAELRDEHQKVRNLENLVFTRGGQLISISALRKAFEKAMREAKIEDFHFHDFRHTAKTRWAEMGIAPEVSMLAGGHKTLKMHSRYVNIREKGLKEAFSHLMPSVPTPCTHDKTETVCNIVSS